LEQQWPPAPIDGKRISHFGHLRLENDGDSLYGTQPTGPVFLLRYYITCVTGVSIVTLYRLYSLAPATPGTRWIAYLSTAMRAYGLYYIMLVAIGVAAYFGLKKFIRFLCHTDPFTFTRDPRTLRPGRSQTIALPASAYLSVATRSARDQRTKILWLTVPGEEDRKDQRIGLAIFANMDDAERAKSEIERFLRADETKAEPITG
jgi:hypothetical protein